MLTAHFIRRGYPRHLILSAVSRALKLDRDTLLNKDHLIKSINQPSPDNSNDTFYCITMHNPLNPPIKKIVKRNWELLERTKGTRVFMDAKLIFGLRRNKNLSMCLVRASTSSKPNNTVKHTTNNPCNQPLKCRYCKKMKKTSKIYSSDKRRTFEPLRNVSYMTYRPLNTTYNHNSIMSHIINITYIFHLLIMSSYMFSKYRYKTIINHS